jgi:uncharacterized HhH-GPD family protein
MLTSPDSLPYTGDHEADALLAHDPMALLIGFVLDQQVSIQKAFAGPLELQRRIGSLDATFIAAMEPLELEEAFRRRPALHRFPANMARRTQELCGQVAARHGGRAERIWTEAQDGPELEERLLRLPGIGPMKAGAIIAILARRFGLQLPGIEAVTPTYATLADVDSAEALARYQAQKRAHKEQLDAASGVSGASTVGGG